MLALHDTLLWEGKRWLVRKIDPLTRTAFLSTKGNEQDTLPIDADQRNVCRVLGNPPRDWPFILLPSRKGRVIQVEKAGRGLLDQFESWVRLDDFQIGGPLFLNPDLRLVYQDKVLVSLQLNGQTKVVISTIPRDFRPAAQKIPPPKPEPKLETSPFLFKSLLDDDE